VRLRDLAFPCVGVDWLLPKRLRRYAAIIKKGGKSFEWVEELVMRLRSASQIREMS
jgi:hypothetical protein